MGEARYKREARSDLRARRAYYRALAFYLHKTTFLFDAEMGKRIAEARKDMGKTQRQFAEVLGISQSDVCRLEAGKLRTLPMTAAEFITALPEYFHHVLFGSATMPRSGHYYADLKAYFGKRR